jgi:phage terminase large subunit-like protein
MYRTQTNVPASLVNLQNLSGFMQGLRQRDTSKSANKYDDAWYRNQARHNQVPPAGDWRTWLILAGRGWGKTRTGAEWIRSLQHTAPRMAIIAPTFADARDTCIEGESGLRAICNDGEIVKWNRSIGELEFATGAQVKLFSGDKPDRLRGPQHHAIWLDELAAFQYMQAAWDMAMFGLRLGTDPRAVVTTTPRPLPLVKRLLADATTHVTKGSTYDNRANLAPAFFAEIVTRYEGTRLGRQELNAELIDDVEGALWNRSTLEANRVTKFENPVTIVVGVDPKANAEVESETGIVAAALCHDGNIYIIDDASINDLPDKWAKQVVSTYNKWRADRVVAEVNQGGDMVVSTLRAVDAHLPITKVHATKGKYTRAEPISALYEQGKVRHVGSFPKLEDQMCTWLPGEDSPDRLDALVWAVTNLAGRIGQGRRARVGEY